MHFVFEFENWQGMIFLENCLTHELYELKFVCMLNKTLRMAHFPDIFSYFSDGLLRDSMSNEKTKCWIRYSSHIYQHCRWNEAGQRSQQIRSPPSVQLSQESLFVALPVRLGSVLRYFLGGSSLWGGATNAWICYKYQRRNKKYHLIRERNILTGNEQWTWWQSAYSTTLRRHFERKITRQTAHYTRSVLHMRLHA